MQSISLKAVLADANLFAAWAKVKENRGRSGADGVSIGQFEQALLANMATLRDEVFHGLYRPQPLLRIHIPKEGGGTRPLSIPSVRDRVLQTAVTLVLTPRFEAEFEECSFAYRQGRSVDQAVRRVIRLRDAGYRWVVDADIEAFFDEIDHDLLLQEVARLVDDAAILKLIRLWLKSTVVDGDHRFRFRKGVPQGSPISPLLSNLYLDHLDERFLNSETCLVRFADDFLILCKTREHAEAALEMTEEVLEELRLNLNEDKTRLVNFDQGLRFLGVHFVRSLVLKSKRKKRILPQASILKTDNIENAEDFDTEPQNTAALLRWLQGRPGNDAMRDAIVDAGVVAADFLQADEAPKKVEQSTPPRATVVVPEHEIIAEESEETVDHDPRLRTLYLTEHDYALAKSGERLVVQRNDEPIKSIPAIKVDQVMVLGNAAITTPAMQFCLARRIPIYLFSAKGRYHGVIDAFDTDAVLLHRDQFVRSDDETFALEMARGFVTGKLTNARRLLARYSRHRDAPSLTKAVETLKKSNPDTAKTLDQLRGIEGSAARAYFSALVALFDRGWKFKGRVKQPPTDPINAMLSYGYTILFHNVHSLLKARGLNPHVGFLHALRPGHPALASDVMEEFRPLVVDAVVLNLVLNKKLTPEDFTLPETVGEACLLGPKAKTVFIKALESKLNTVITHPRTGLKLDYRRCMEHQINHLAAVIRGREAEYSAMVLR